MNSNPFLFLYFIMMIVLNLFWLPNWSNFDLITSTFIMNFITVKRNLSNLINNKWNDIICLCIYGKDILASRRRIVYFLNSYMNIHKNPKFVYAFLPFYFLYPFKYIFSYKKVTKVTEKKKKKIIMKMTKKKFSSELRYYHMLLRVRTLF